MDLSGIQKQIEELRKIYEDLKILYMGLVGTRGVAGLILNNTDEVLLVGHYQQDDGQFARTPPQSVAPRSTAGFASAGGTIPPHGAIGSVHYSAPDLLLKWDWNNPVVGDNTAISQLEDPSGRYRAWATIGGETKTSAELGISELPSDAGWRSCQRCQTLYREGWQARAAVCVPVRSGVAEGFGTHDPSKSFDYVLTYQSHAADWAAGETDGQQSNWRCCVKCNGLFYDGSDAKGVCNADWYLDDRPARFGGTGGIVNRGEGHRADPLTPIYRLPYDYTPTAGRRAQGGWMWCNKCYALSFAGSGRTGGTCPSSRTHSQNSNDYVLNHT
jgi:hypothetical protein